jgi:hypothetical protein
MCDNDIRCNKYCRKIILLFPGRQPKAPRGPEAVLSQGGPIICGASAGPARPTDLPASGPPPRVVSIPSAGRDCRARGRSLVTSGSRVIKRPAISPQGSPCGAPRRIRKTLYCVDERSSALSTPIALRVSTSAVRSKSRNAVSSGLPTGRTLLDWATPQHICYNDYCQDTCYVFRTE